MRKQSPRSAVKKTSGKTITAISKTTPKKSAAPKASGKKSAARKTDPKKTGPKKKEAKKPAVKKSVAKKTGAAKSLVKKVSSKKTTAKKPAATTTASKKAAPKKTTTKKSTSKKTAPKKAAPKKTAPPKPPVKKKAAAKSTVHRAPMVRAPFDSYKGIKPYIFVSYAHKNMKDVFQVIKKLSDSRYRVWYDEGIEPGFEWPEVVGKALLGCSQFVVFMSPPATESRNVRNEINLAFSEHKDIMVVFLEKTTLSEGMKLQIGAVQFLNRFEMSEREFLEKLKKVLNSDLRG